MQDLYSVFEKKARKYIPPFIAPSAKKIIAYPRYYSQLRKCRSRYNEYKESYSQTTLFIAGLPKSGTTWFEKMLSSLPGFSDIMIPEAVTYEQAHKESHSFNFPSNL